tara:strand:+ start:424 stop:645 length:222 start_codon:yes stop_codon:yes gene_type:complete
MNFSIKKFFFSISFNLSLFLVLIIGLQNSSNKSRINLLFNETVKLPIGFTIGISFITGNVIGNLLPIDYRHKK